VTDPAAPGLFGSDLWEATLEKYSGSTHLTVRLFDADERAVFGPVHSTPIFGLFQEAGYDPGIFADCARRCIAQTGNRPAVLVAQFHGLAVVGASLALEGRIVGAAVAGYAFADFSQAAEIHRLALQSKVSFDRLWQVARTQRPVARQRLIVQGELLQVLGDALLREDHRLRQYEQAAAIVNSSDDAIMSSDLEGDTLSWNAGAERLFGYVAEEAVGKPATLLDHPDGLGNERTILERIGRGEKIEHYETVYRRKDGSPVEVSLTASPIRNRNGTLTGTSTIARDISERKRQERQRELLVNELNHRVKNSLATVQSLAAQTLGHSATLAEGRDAFEARLMALAKAHDVLTREQWQGASLHQLVADAIAAYSGGIDAGRFDVTGPAIRLRPPAALVLSMALHELATNATKYGALSNGAGQVEIRWRLVPGVPQRFQLRWAESGGPPVKSPGRRGFGSRLIERGLAQDLAGDVGLDFVSSGVLCTVDAPLEEVGEAT
jgi:PAS domain S-box-containing protein